MQQNAKIECAAYIGHNIASVLLYKNATCNKISKRVELAERGPLSASVVELVEYKSAICNKTMAVAIFC